MLVNQFRLPTVSFEYILDEGEDGCVLKRGIIFRIPTCRIWSNDVCSWFEIGICQERWLLGYSDCWDVISSMLSLFLTTSSCFISFACFLIFFISMYVAATLPSLIINFILDRCGWYLLSVWDALPTFLFPICVGFCRRMLHFLAVVACLGIDSWHYLDFGKIK